MSASCPLRAPAAVLAWEEAETSGMPERPCFYCWRPRETAVVLGISQSPERELRIDEVKRAALPVLRRPSGGGTVLLGPGVLGFGAIAPWEFLGNRSGIREAFRFLTAPVIEACRSLGVDARVAGISDLAAPGPDPGSGSLVKIAGTAQLRKRKAVCVHGSLLVALDRSLIDTYLAFPSDQPDYRSDRSHRDFCRNLSELLGASVSMDKLALSIRRFAEQNGYRWIAPPEALDELALPLLIEKYRSEDWNWRRKRPRKS